MEREWFSLVPSGGVHLFEPPADLQVDARQAAVAAMKGGSAIPLGRPRKAVEQLDGLHALFRLWRQGVVY